MSADQELRDALQESASEAAGVDDVLAGYIVVALVNHPQQGTQGLQVWSHAHCEGCAAKIVLLQEALKTVAQDLAQREAPKH